MRGSTLRSWPPMWREDGVYLFELPIGPHEMTGIPVGISFQVILMLGLGLPEITGRCNLGHHFSRPKTRGIDIGDGLSSDSLLLLARVEDRRSIARPGVVALPVPRARIMNLEEEFENLTVAEFCGVEDDLDRFGMGAVIAVGRIAHLAARVADPR